MNDKWIMSRIGDLGKVVTGKTPPTADSENYGGELPFITPSDMKGQKYIKRTERTISAKGRAHVKNLVIPPRAVFVSCIGSDMGKVGMTRVESVTNQQINSIIVRDGIDPDYVYYNLFSRKDELQRLATSGSAQPILNKGHFSQLKMALPPLPKQRAIASILGALDDKIELNKRMNETLEVMARAVFKSWFVDFDPIPGLGPHREWQDSHLGRIPKGWMVLPLGEICKCIFSGGTPSTKNEAFWDGKIPWLSSGETRDSFIIETVKTITNQGVEGSSTRLAKSGTTVIASAGQGNTRGQTSLLMLDSYINQSLIALEAKDDYVSSRYLFFDLERRYEQFRQLSDSHSSRGSLTTKLLANIKVAVPPRRLVSKAEEVLTSYVDRLCCGLKESLILAAIRDALLPKLLSGEIRIRNAERYWTGVSYELAASGKKKDISKV